MTAVDPSHEAKAFLTLLWTHIYNRVQAMLHPHHNEHEPGGNDEVRLPIGFLKDVSINAAADGDALVYEASTGLWIPGSAGGGEGELLYWLPGVLVAGTQPMTIHNRTTRTLHITEIFVDVSDAPLGGGISFGVGGVGSVGVDEGNNTAQTAVDYDFPPEATITVSVTLGDAIAGNALIHLPYT